MEYETNLMNSDETDLIADRSSNPKLSDVYNLFNKLRKCNIGARTGKYLFEEQEKSVNSYNEDLNGVGGKTLLQQYCNYNGTEEPLILAI